MFQEKDIDDIITHLEREGDTVAVVRTTMGLTEMENYWVGLLSSRALNPELVHNIWSGISTSGMLVFSTTRGLLLVSWIMDNTDSLLSVEKATERDIEEAYESLEMVTSDVFKKFTSK